MVGAEPRVRQAETGRKTCGSLLPPYDWPLADCSLEGESRSILGMVLRSLVETLLWSEVRRLAQPRWCELSRDNYVDPDQTNLMFVLAYSRLNSQDEWSKIRNSSREQAGRSVLLEDVEAGPLVDEIDSSRETKAPNSKIAGAKVEVGRK